MGPSSSSLSQYRHQIGQFENRESSSRVEDRALERAIARATRNDQGNYNGRSVTAAKAMIGVIIASSIAAGVASAATSSSSGSGCLRVTRASQNGTGFGAVNVTNTCDWGERVTFKQECIKRNNGHQKSFDIKPHENTILSNVKGRCYREGRWKSERVYTEKEVMCEIARGSNHNKYVRMAKDWVSSSGTSCSQGKKIQRERMEEMKEGLSTCYDLDNKDKFSLKSEEKEKCFTVLTDAAKLMKEENQGVYSLMLDQAAAEFDPGECKGHVTLQRYGGVFTRVCDKLNEEEAKKTDDQPGTVNDLLCELAKGPENNMQAVKARELLSRGDISCSESKKLTREEMIDLQDMLVECVSYEGSLRESISTDKRKSCYETLKSASDFVRSRNKDGDEGRANLLSIAADEIYSGFGGRYINYNGLRGVMGSVYDALSDLVNFDSGGGDGSKGRMEQIKTADEMLCGFSYGVDSDPQVKLAKQWVDSSSMNCMSMIEAGGRDVIEQLQKDLVKCYGFDGKSRKDIPKEDKEQCQQALTDAAYLMTKGVENGEVYAQLLRSAVVDFSPDRCDGYINLNSIKSSLSKASEILKAKLGVDIEGD